MDQKQKALPKVPKFGHSEASKPNEQINSAIENFFAEIAEEKVEVPAQEPAKQQILPQTQQVTKPQNNLPQIKDLSKFNDKLSFLLKKQEGKKDINPPALPKSPHQKPVLKPTLSEEYDPSKPNDYEEFIRQNRELRKIQPPIEEEPLSIAMEEEVVEEQPTAEEKALKMMEKYGFQLGKGLGKNLQGMTTPLIAKKTTDAVGVIKASEIDMTRVLPQIAKKQTDMELNNK